jgi:UDP-glucuronate decarboxylase
MMNNDQGFVGPVNIGNPSEFTIKELAQKVLQMIPQSNSRIIYEPLPQDDPKQRQPDTALARRMLDWQANISLDLGLVPTIAYFQSLLSASVALPSNTAALTGV